MFNNTLGAREDAAAQAPGGLVEATAQKREDGTMSQTDRTPRVTLPNAART